MADYPVWDQHIKWIKKDELESYKMIDNLRSTLGDVAPKIIKICIDPDKRFNCDYVIITERYSSTLKEIMKMDYEKAMDILYRAKELVQELHKLKILHTDLHESNIIYDEPTDRVSLIDFDGTINLTNFLKKVSA